MKNNIKRIWCQCCDEGDNENCDIRVNISIDNDDENETEIVLHFDSELIVIHTECKDFEVDQQLTLEDVEFFVDSSSENSWCYNFLGSCDNIEDEAFINIEFDDGKIFEDDIVNALRYLISTNNETEST